MKVFVLTIGWVACVGTAFSQELLPVPPPVNSTAAATSNNTATPNVDSALSPTLASLRIPAALIAEEASQTFTHSTPVDRVVLGTHSRGTATCQGQVRCELQERSEGAEFVCRISGTIHSDTCGINGPATIASTANTTYTAVKRIVFKGRQLITQPAVLKATTRVQIAGIGSTAPGFRGRIVRRVASRRAADSLPEAEAITQQLTINELQQHIDTEFDQRIAVLNRKLASRLAILDAFSQGDYLVTMDSHRDFIEILLTRQVLPAELHGSLPVTLPNLPLMDNVVLWIPLPKVEEGQIDVGDWGFSDVLKYVPLWLSAPLSQIKINLDARTPRLAVLRHEDWIGIQLDQDAVPL